MSLLSRLQAALQPLADDAQAPGEDALQLAAAVLLLEMERADYQHDASERVTILKLLQTQFRLNAEAAEVLVAEASERADKAVSLHDYVQTLNDHFSAADKLHIIRMLWQVAFADGELHHYEEHLLRQLSDLLHVPHRDYVRVKLQVSGEI
jgi:uncharacterized tellurite resistance protein B-like protein